MVTPKDWDDVRLGYLGTTFGGLTGKSAKDFGDGQDSFITFMNVMTNVCLAPDGTELVRIGTGEKQNKVHPGDIIFNGSSETPDEVGFGSMVPQELSGRYLNSFCFGFRSSDSSSLDPLYFSYLTRSPLGRKIIRPMAQGSTRYNLAKSNLLNGVFPLPPLGEQTAIAQALTDVDEAIKSLEALIAKKRDINQATMQQLLTGRTRLSGFTDEWEEIRLGDIGRCIRGVSYKGDSDLSAWDTSTTVRLLRSNNVQDSEIEFNDVQYVNNQCVSDQQILQPNDVLICMANGSKVLVGKTGLFEKTQDMDYTFGAFMGCFRTYSNLMSAKFIRYLFLTKLYRDYISNLLAGSSINNLTPTSIESLVFTCPSLREQEAIAETLSGLDEELAALKRQVIKMGMVKLGMMQDLLTGNVRLV